MSGAPIQITATVVGAESVRLNFVNASARSRERIREEVERLSIQLQRKVKEEKLSGQVLHVKTGRLKRSINKSVRVNGDEIVGTVGTNVNYGAFWERGFDRPVGADASGGLANLGGLAREIHIYKHPPGIKHFAARPFLAPSLEEMRPEVRMRLARAAIMAVRG